MYRQKYIATVPPWMAVVPRSSDVSAVPKLVVKTIHGCIVLTDGQIADSVYIFEFKLSGNGSAQDAIAQIQKQNYAAKYKTERKKIVLIGSSFSEETRTIKDWKIEMLEK